MAPAPAAAVVAIAAPVKGKVSSALAGSGAAVVVVVDPLWGTDDGEASLIGIVLPPGKTVSVVVGGIGLPAFAASLMLRIAGPDHTSAAPTPIAVEPPRTKARRERPAAATSTGPGGSSPSSDALSGGVLSSGAQTESSTFPTGSPFPRHSECHTSRRYHPARAAISHLRNG